MAKRKGKFSKSDSSIEFYGTEELLRKLVDAGANLEDAMYDALVKSSVPIKDDLLEFIRRHRLTGVTEKSFEDLHELNRAGGYMLFKIGYNIKKGGLPALFLDVGTPKIKPSFFVYHAFENNVSKVKRAQEEALQEAFKELL